MSDTSGNQTPPAGENIHLPDGSLLPLVMAIGITGIVVGVTTSWYVFGAGVLVFLITLIRWIKEARAEYLELPLDHDDDH